MGMKKARARIGSLGEDRLWHELHWLRAFEGEERGKMEPVGFKRERGGCRARAGVHKRAKLMVGRDGQ